MKFTNGYSRKIKNSYPLLITCAACKNQVATYQKHGKGGLINMYIDRIISSNLEITSDIKALSCPNCTETLGIRVSSKDLKTDSFRMIRGTFHCKKI